MAYCILRVAKIKSRASLARSMQHNTRQRQPDNADPAKRMDNDLMFPAGQAMERYTARLPEKVRKNAVHAVEIMIALPPECSDMPKDMADEYLQAATEWVTNRLGGPQNRLNATFHYDERTPHVHVTMMPLKDGKLNYRAFLGGSRDALVRLQTDFAAEVGANYGLERGRPRAETGRRHITVGRYYAIGADAVAKEIERQQTVARLDREHRASIAPAVEKAKEKDRKPKRDQGLSL